MIAASQYPAFSRNFDDEQDYADAAASAARRASPLLRKLAPILRWRRQDKRQPPNKVSFLNESCADKCERRGRWCCSRCACINRQYHMWMNGSITRSAKLLFPRSLKDRAGQDRGGMYLTKVPKDARLYDHPFDTLSTSELMGRSLDRGPNHPRGTFS